MKIKHRIDTVENNERLHLDARDVISLLQGLSTDLKLKLDTKTMMYVESLFRSLLTTYEALESETTLIINHSYLKRLKKKVYRMANKNIKLLEEAQEQSNNSVSALLVEENLDTEEAEEGSQ